MKFEKEIKILENNKRVKNIGANTIGVLWFLFDEKPYHMAEHNGKMVVFDERNKEINFNEFIKVNKFLESKSEINKSELAKLFTINNVRGKVFKDKDIDDNVLKSFNNELKDFSKKYDDFDLFDDEYTGKSSDEFMEMLDDAAKKSGGKLSLFENDTMNDVIDTLDGKTGEEAKNILIGLHESYNVLPKKIKSMFQTKLNESIGSNFKTGTIANKIAFGIKLTESDTNSIKDCVGLTESMTLEQYLSQEEPIRNPTVNLSKNDYTLGTKIGGTQSLYINGIDGVEYATKDNKHVYTTDRYGNLNKLSVFRII